MMCSIPFQSLSKETRTREKIDKLSAYTLDVDILYYKSRICDIEVENYRKNIIYDCHDIPISGHPGFQKTRALVKKRYFWSGLKRDVNDHVKRCLLCQTNKVEQVKHSGLLQPLSVLTRVHSKWACSLNKKEIALTFSLSKSSPSNKFSTVPKNDSMVSGLTLKHSSKFNQI